MKHTRIDLELAANQTFYISPLFDMHRDTPHHDHKALDRIMRERSALPNHYFIDGGDSDSLLLPTDAKRFRNSAQPEYARGLDSVLNATVKQNVAFYKRYPKANWAVKGYGNHEVSILKYHNFDIVEKVCEEVGINRGGYSGWISFVVARKNSNDRKAFTILYHHGFPTGEAEGGRAWARRYSSTMAGWQVFCYGHNHQLRAEPSVFTELGVNGYENTYYRYIVNAGTYEKNSPLNDEIGSYTEVKGMGLKVIGSPLISVTLRRDVTDSKRDKMYFDYKVTV